MQARYPCRLRGGIASIRDGSIVGVPHIRPAVERAAIVLRKLLALRGEALRKTYVSRFLLTKDVPGRLA